MENRFTLAPPPKTGSTSMGSSGSGAGAWGFGGTSSSSASSGKDLFGNFSGFKQEPTVAQNQPQSRPAPVMAPPSGPSYMNPQAPSPSNAPQFLNRPVPTPSNDLDFLSDYPSSSRTAPSPQIQAAPPQTAPKNEINLLDLI